MTGIDMPDDHHADMKIHEEFKELVDALLTEFITELGVSAETFYEVVAQENSGDNLNRLDG